MKTHALDLVPFGGMLTAVTDINGEANIVEPTTSEQAQETNGDITVSPHHFLFTFQLSMKFFLKLKHFLNLII